MLPYPKLSILFKVCLSPLQGGLSIIVNDIRGTGDMTIYLPRLWKDIYKNNFSYNTNCGIAHEMLQQSYFANARYIPFYSYHGCLYILVNIPGDTMLTNYECTTVFNIKSNLQLLFLRKCLRTALSKSSSNVRNGCLAVCYLLRTCKLVDISYFQMLYCTLTIIVICTSWFIFGFMWQKVIV